MSKNLNFLEKLKNIKLRKWAIIVIIVISFLLIAFLMIGKKDNVKSINSAKQMSELAEAIQKFYRNRPNAWGLNTNTVIKEKISPSNMVQGGQGLVNYLDKKATVGSDKNGNMLMPGDRSFKITYWDLNKEECIELASQQINEKMQLSLYSITISNENESVYSWGGTNSLPVEEMVAKGACSSQNAITWDILL